MKHKKLNHKNPRALWLCDCNVFYEAISSLIVIQHHMLFVLGWKMFDCEHLLTMVVINLKTLYQIFIYIWFCWHIIPDTKMHKFHGPVTLSPGPLPLCT